MTKNSQKELDRLFLVTYATYMNDILIKIFKHLEIKYSSTILKEFATTNEADLIIYHFGMGTYIRNTFIWDNNLYLELKAYYKESHVDTISSYIIRDFQQYLKTKP